MRSRSPLLCARSPSRPRNAAIYHRGTCTRPRSTSTKTARRNITQAVAPCARPCAMGRPFRRTGPTTRCTWRCAPQEPCRRRTTRNDSAGGRNRRRTTTTAVAPIPQMLSHRAAAPGTRHPLPSSAKCSLEPPSRMNPHGTACSTCARTRGTPGVQTVLLRASAAADQSGDRGKRTAWRADTPRERRRRRLRAGAPALHRRQTVGRSRPLCGRKQTPQ